MRKMNSRILGLRLRHGRIEMWDYRIIREDGKDMMYIAPVYYQKGNDGVCWEVEHHGDPVIFGKDRLAIAEELSKALLALSRPTLNAHPVRATLSVTPCGEMGKGHKMPNWTIPHKTVKVDT